MKNFNSILSQRFMLQQLYALVHGDIQPDNPDSPMNQEVLLAGHLYLMFFKVYKSISFFFFQTKVPLRKNFKKCYITLE